MPNAAIVIPSLNPDNKLDTLVYGLVEAGFMRILLIDDGSDPAHRKHFEALAKLPACTVLTHDVNQGKGRALKTAFAYYLQDPGDSCGVVTVDGDGQHSVQDIVQCAEALCRHPDALVIGVRDFAAPNVPPRSRTGNKLTRLVFRLGCGLDITDTQTGLRGISNSFAQTLLDVQGERYDFETNMLLETKPHGVPIVEVPISTIYIDQNATSHFHPLWDSLRIYGRILRYSFSSLLSSLVDLLLFALLNGALAFLPASQRYLAATVGARVCSALFNFLLNKTFVFHSKTGTAQAALRYYLLCAVQMMCSYGGLYLLAELGGLPALPTKIVVDTLLFFASYFVQRKWVFAQNKTTGA